MKDFIVVFPIEAAQYIEQIPKFLMAWNYDDNEKPHIQEWGKLEIVDYWTKEPINIRFYASSPSTRIRIDKQD